MMTRAKFILFSIIIGISGCSGVELSPEYQYELETATAIVEQEAIRCERGQIDPNECCEALGLASNTLDNLLKASQGRK